MLAMLLGQVVVALVGIAIFCRLVAQVEDDRVQLRAVTYDDTLRRHDGRWSISLRLITPLHPASAV